jgi:putative membrane protein insertion efficiency factor
MKGQIREIKIWDLISHLPIPIASIVLLWTLVRILFLSYIPLPPLVFYIAAGIGTYFLVERVAIGAVLAYKAFAPLEVRKRCRFKPTCSTYMIMAIKKYGLVYGVFKGIRRLLRCKPPNGGVDYP